MERIREWIKRIVTVNATAPGGSEMLTALNRIEDSINQVVAQVKQIENEVTQLKKRIEVLERQTNGRGETVIDSLLIAEHEIRRLREFVEVLCRELKYRGWGHVCR